VFVDEISQQPDALREVVHYYRSPDGREALGRLTKLHASGDGRHGRPVYFTGMGSSLYAADAVLPQLNEAGIDARAWEAGEWLHYGPPDLSSRALVIAVSQSGESVETRVLAERIGGRAALVAVTNDEASSLARSADLVLPMRAGHEEMISTKTYTNSLGVLLLAAGVLTGEAPDITSTALLSAADGMEQALDALLELHVQQAAEWLDRASTCHAIARGPALAAARGGALILGEGAHLAVTALPGASFRHGPMELAGEGHAALLCMPVSRTRALMDRLLDDLLRAGSHVVALTGGTVEVESPRLTTIGVDAAQAERFFPLPAAIIIERLLAAVAARRGLMPGQFRFGGKITDQE
jgi:glutamine---fructose-6-phosphate transaminase (isomerizing)